MLFCHLKKIRDDEDAMLRPQEPPWSDDWVMPALDVEGGLLPTWKVKCALGLGDAAWWFEMNNNARGPSRPSAQGAIGHVTDFLGKSSFMDGPRVVVLRSLHGGDRKPC